MNKTIKLDDLNATKLYQDLWQGARPPDGMVLYDRGIRVLVFCAMEHQPRARKYPNLEVIYAPNYDDESTPIGQGEL